MIELPAARVLLAQRRSSDEEPALHQIFAAGVLQPIDGGGSYGPRVARTRPVRRCIGRAIRGHRERVLTHLRGSVGQR